MRTPKRALWVLVTLAVLALVVEACAPASPVATPPAATAPAASSPVTKPPTAAAPASTAPAATPAAKVSTTGTQEPQDQPLSPPVKLKVGVTPVFASIGIFAALEKGYFKDQGLDVELVNFQSGDLMTAPMATGDLQVGSGALSAGTFNAIARGLAIKIVADQNSATSSSTNAWVVRKDLAGSIKTFADWKGHTVSMQAKGNISELLMDMALTKGGLTANDVNLIILPFDQVPVAMANKSVDISHSNEPFTAAGVEQGTMVRWMDIAQMDPGHEFSVIDYSPVFIKDNPEAADRFMVAYIKGVRYYLNAVKSDQGKAEMISILGKHAPVKDPSLYQKAMFPSINPDGYANAKSIASDQDWYAAHGLVNQKVDLTAAIDNQYVDYALRKLGHAQ